MPEARRPDPAPRRLLFHPIPIYYANRFPRSSPRAPKASRLPPAPLVYRGRPQSGARSRRRRLSLGWPESSWPVLSLSRPVVFPARPATCLLWTSARGRARTRRPPSATTTRSTLRLILAPPSPWAQISTSRSNSPRASSDGGPLDARRTDQKAPSFGLLSGPGAAVLFLARRAPLRRPLSASRGPKCSLAP